MASSTEIEMTARCTKEQWEILLNTLRSSEVVVHMLDRFMVRVWKGEVVAEDPIDVRVKWTNGKEEIVIKTGGFGAQSRQELEIALPSGQFRNAVEGFRMLGFTTGCVMHRVIERCTQGDVEISLVRGREWYYVEVEYTGASDDFGVAQARIREWFAAHGLEPFETTAYLAFVKELSATENLHYPLSDYPAGLDKDPRWAQLWGKITQSTGR
jgi:hypothetical protein